MRSRGASARGLFRFNPESPRKRGDISGMVFVVGVRICMAFGISGSGRIVNDPGPSLELASAKPPHHALPSRSWSWKRDGSAHRSVYRIPVPARTSATNDQPPARTPMSRETFRVGSGTIVGTAWESVEKVLLRFFAFSRVFRISN